MDIEEWLAKGIEPSTTLKQRYEVLYRLACTHDKVTALSDKVLSYFAKFSYLCISSSSPTMRAGTLKILRIYIEKFNELYEELVKMPVFYFVSICLDKPKGQSKEKLQALKLIRTLIKVNASLIPRSIVQSLVSCSEQRDEPHCRVCVELLAKIALLDPEIVALCGGFRTLLNSIVVLPCSDSFRDSLMLVISYLLNNQETRSHIRPNSELRILLSPLVELYDSDPEKMEPQWQASKSAIVSLFKSWAGFLCMASDPNGLSAIVKSLQLQNVELNFLVIEALFQIFHIDLPLHHPSICNTSANKDLASAEFFDRSQRFNVLDGFRAALLVPFINAGLFETLAALANRMKIDRLDEMAESKSKKEQIAMRVQVLLSELLLIANRVLPIALCVRLQTLPRLVCNAIDFDTNPRFRSVSTSIVTILHNYSHQKAVESQMRMHTSALIGVTQFRRVRGIDRRLDRIDEVKIKVDSKMEEPVLLQKIKETGVIVTKDTSKWNWDLIIELIEGPLLNPTLFAATIKTKYFKRLLSFHKPTNKTFMVMPSNEQNRARFTRHACEMLDLLMSNETGMQLLNNHKLFPQIAELLRDECQITPEKKPKDRPLNETNLLKTMVRDYFILIGVASGTQQGVDMLAKTKVFDYLGPMSVIKGRDDLCHLIMTSLDYNLEGPSRILLARSLRAKSKVVRFYATRQMRLLYRAKVSQFDDWGIKLLVRQLEDEDQKIINLTLEILDEACDNKNCLESLISKNPYDILLTKGRVGKDLLIRCLSRSSGFKALAAQPFINNELELWRRTEFISYASRFEQSVGEAFATAVWSNKTGSADLHVNLPPHFYGELVRTSDGCAVLKQSGHFPDYVSILKSSDASSLEKRGALWVVAHVGKSKKGAKFLEETGAYQTIVELAENATCLSLKGMAFYALGMLACTRVGQRTLGDFGWDATPDSCIAVPKTQSAFYTVPQWEHRSSWPLLSSTLQLPYAEGDPRHEVYTFAINLSNHITTDKAVNNLKRLKTQPNSDDLFMHPELQVHILRALEYYKFRLPVRRFLYSLFDGIQFTLSELPLFGNYFGRPTINRPLRVQPRTSSVASPKDCVPLDAPSRSSVMDLSPRAYEPPALQTANSEDKLKVPPSRLRLGVQQSVSTTSAEIDKLRSKIVAPPRPTPPARKDTPKGAEGK